MKADIEMYDALKIEPEIMKYWKESKIYEKAKEKNKGKKQWYFLDGPPYTSGKMHLGLAWNKSLKDCVLRYKRMKGLDVWDRAGYDMHGLPTELKVQAKLKIKSKEDIPKFGVKKFIDECKKWSVENMQVMNKDFARLGIWMDFENAYQPISSEFIEGEWWLIKQAYKAGRLYEGDKTMQWCKSCATALAKHELEYKNVKDNSIFLKFKVKDSKNEYLVIWTTTPWTIPFNLGIMANPEFEYVKCRVDDEVWILAKGLAASVITFVAEKKFEIIEELKGEKLEGLEYEHPFSDEISFYEQNKKKHPKIHTVVLSEDFVDLSAGSGLVHMAPGCGPEDFEIGRQNNIPPFNNLDEYGVFPEAMGKFKGWVAKDEDKRFIEELDTRGVLIAQTPVEHDYAHCWRCKSPVIFKTTKQWFFKVEDLKEKLRKLNSKVDWSPDWAGSRQMDSWLNNLKDNGITRQRYWGTPAPIWKCKKCKSIIVVGSLKDIERHGGKIPDDLHKPKIDKVVLKCKCKGEMNRIPDVLDVWIDAGTNSWTCLDYPRKRKHFEELFPADFILEGKDQIRGWFNLLLVASMLAFEKHPYKAVYMHGFISDALGRKMSKSLGNIISPYEVIDKHGADLLRYYMIGGANPGLDINYNFDDLNVKKRHLSVLWNLHKFLFDYAREVGCEASKLKEGDVKLGTQERFMLSKLNSAKRSAAQAMESYAVDKLPGIAEDLFLTLSRTYIQLVREKSQSGSQKEREGVLYVLYNTIMDLLTMFAPVAPYVCEKMFLNLSSVHKAKELSVHHLSWPKFDESIINSTLEEKFVHAGQVMQGILHAREKASLGVRWPISQVIIETDDKDITAAIKDLEEIIKTQTNVKKIQLVKKFDQVKESIKLDYSQLGPDYKDLVPRIISRIMAESTKTILSQIEKEGSYTFDVDGRDVKIVKEYLIVKRDVPEIFRDAEFRGGVVFLDRRLDSQLEAEGYARELMRRVQAERKSMGLVKTDSIDLKIKADPDIKDLLEKHKEQISSKVGAQSIELVTDLPDKRSFKHVQTFKVRDEEFTVLINLA